MTDQTPTTAQIRTGYASVAYTHEGADLRLVEFDRWLAAHDAEVRAGVVAEEPEWEYGVALAGGDPDGYIYRWPTLEAAEALAELNPAYKPSYYRRVKAGPWEPLPEGADQ